LLEKTFPESDLPLTWEPIAAAEGRFELTGLRNDRDDYYQTLQLWEQNLLKQRAQTVSLVAEATAAEFHGYLRLFAMGFRMGMVSLLRMSFLKILIRPG
jgi:cyclopropane-fatty-acyl-phospholipid synthase